MFTEYRCGDCGCNPDDYGGVGMAVAFCPECGSRNIVEYVAELDYGMPDDLDDDGLGLEI